MRAIVVLALAAAMLCAADDHEANTLSGRRAPGFSLPDSQFQQYDLQDYRGAKWVVIEFMRTDCPYCRDLSRALEQAKAKFEGKIQFLAVVLPPDNMNTVATYIRDLGVTYPLLFDMGQMAASYFKATPLNPTFHTPHLFIIDPKGTIVRDFGHSDATNQYFQAAGLSKLLEDLVSGKAAPTPLREKSASLDWPSTNRHQMSRDRKGAHDRSGPSARS